MSDFNKEKLLFLAVQTALRAGSLIMSIYESGDFKKELKSDQSPLTKADRAAHEFISENLHEAGFPVLSEEGRDISFSERKHWSTLWIVDPLDGTKEFIARNGQFTINIALIHDGTPILGVVYAPASGELYWGSEGEGSFLSQVENEISIGEIFLKKIRLPLESESSRPFTIMVSRSHMNESTSKTIEEYKKHHLDLQLVSFGSSLKLCRVASGAADIYPRLAPTMEWDTAAAHAICSSASCSVISYIDRSELKYNKENLLNPWFIVERNTDEC